MEGANRSSMTSPKTSRPWVPVFLSHSPFRPSRSTRCVAETWGGALCLLWRGEGAGWWGFIYLAPRDFSELKVPGPFFFPDSQRFLAVKSPIAR